MSFSASESQVRQATTPATDVCTQFSNWDAHVEFQFERTVGTCGLQFYLGLGPHSCWRCGNEGHHREDCRGERTKFCSRCGRVGVLSRVCCVRDRGPGTARTASGPTATPGSRTEAILPDLRLRPAVPPTPSEPSPPTSLPPLPK